MESFETAAASFIGDDFLDFNVDVGAEDDGDKRPNSVARPLPESTEEELEWLSNKDAFPSIDDIISYPVAGPTHQSPISVLENSNSSDSNDVAVASNGSMYIFCCGNLRVPVRARSSRRRRCRRDLREQEGWCVRLEKTKSPSATVTIGRKCQHCGAEKTPQWRAGPLGPKTLCNACGVRYKSGRLVPEYRPASSPTFSSDLHSNSHRKILEMRKLKQFGMNSVNSVSFA